MNNQDDFAVLRIKGTQYIVSESQEILVKRISEKNLDSDTLLLSKGGNISIGKPVVKNVKAKLEILGEIKGEKVDVLKYKAKSRYRRRIGFRAILTKVKVAKID